MIYPNCSYSTEHNENNARVCPAPPDPDGSIYGVWKVTSCQVRRRKFPYSITTRIKHVAKQNVIKLLVISVQCAKDCLERVKPIRESNQDCLKLESARASLSEERKRVSIFFFENCELVMIFAGVTRSFYSISKVTYRMRGEKMVWTSGFHFRIFLRVINFCTKMEAGK